MFSRTRIVHYFTKSKVLFATLVMAGTFSITIYNQFKTVKATEISGVVSGGRDVTLPVDAIVRISSPIQAQTETDAKGRFKFKLQNLQSDTFLLIVQNKTNNIISKQTEYVSAPEGRTDIVLFSQPVLKEEPVYVTESRPVTTHASRKRSGLKSKLRKLFH